MTSGSSPIPAWSFGMRNILRGEMKRRKRSRKVASSSASTLARRPVFSDTRSISADLPPFVVHVASKHAAARDHSNRNVVAHGVGRPPGEVWRVSFQCQAERPPSGGVVCEKDYPAARAARRRPYEVPIPCPQQKGQVGVCPQLKLLVPAFE